MTRGLSTAKKTAIAGIPRPIHFVSLDFPDGFVYLNSTDRPIKIDLDGDLVDEVYLGAGRLGKIEFGDENAEGRVARARLTLSGIPGAFNATVLQQKYRNRRGRIWHGFVDENYVLVDPPEVRLFGLMQPAPMKLGQQSTVAIDITSRLAAWERASDAGIWDDADHQFRRPGDRWHEFSAEIGAGKDVPWGRA